VPDRRYKRLPLFGTGGSRSWERWLNLLRNTHHELRTPLQSIRCYAEGIEYALMDPRQSAATIISETDRLSELVEDLLYISRVENITSHVEMRENDLRDTLSLCADLLQPMAEKKGLQFEYEFDDQPVLLSYNEKHMYRAFSNLLSNALRYAKGSIILGCHSRAGYAEVSVTDDGPGILLDVLPHIFERFYKGTDGKHGIGLSIVKSVVELHGGEITVESEEKTRFTILLPKK
ncbi:MAG: HAMP domain-containing histidine kinase, partial [Clostridiaceae bacterium]|nr:HAMP domain-containing histidine kinase [Clostridiaceae bacterium]